MGLKAHLILSDLTVAKRGYQGTFEVLWSRVFLRQKKFWSAQEFWRLLVLLGFFSWLLLETSIWGFIFFLVKIQKLYFYFYIPYCNRVVFNTDTFNSLRFDCGWKWLSGDICSSVEQSPPEAGAVLVCPGVWCVSLHGQGSVRAGRLIWGVHPGLWQGHPSWEFHLPRICQPLTPLPTQYSAVWGCDEQSLLAQPQQVICNGIWT